MATNGMTINGLNQLSALTADDKIPVWDTGASGEPTKEITAQNMANSVKSLASLPNTTEMNAAITQSTANLTITDTVVVSFASSSQFTGDVPQHAGYIPLCIQSMAWSGGYNDGPLTVAFLTSTRFRVCSTTTTDRQATCTIVYIKSL